jgi:hypothetical protein
MSNIIYALRRYSVPVESPPTDIPNFGTFTEESDLLWYRHSGYADGTVSWDGGRKVGNGWRFDEVFPGPHGAIYAIEGDADLLWYDHLGIATGARRWVGPRQVGNGWHVRMVNPSPQHFLGVFCDTGNQERSIGELLRPHPSIIYAVRADGTLLWYRHDGVMDGTPSWASNSGSVLGQGWVATNQRVFSGCNGIIYLIGDDGTLRWYKHNGYLEGTFDWEGPIDVGSGWDGFLDVFSIGGGIIYAIDPDGTLWWYKHNGYQNGAADWGERKRVGNGWNANGFSVVCNSVYLKPTFVR